MLMRTRERISVSWSRQGRKKRRPKEQIASRDSRRLACHFARENVRVKMAGIFLGNNSADVAAWLNFDEWKERNHGYSFVPTRAGHWTPAIFFNLAKCFCCPIHDRSSRWRSFISVTMLQHTWENSIIHTIRCVKKRERERETRGKHKSVKARWND